MKRHLVLAALDVAAGELTHAVRIARALIAAGEEVVFLVPSGLDQLVAELGARRGWVDDAMQVLDRAVLSVVERDRPDTVLLADGVSVVLAMASRGLAFASFARELTRRTRTIALDVWNLPEAGLTIDYGADT